jgi:peroxiredoxin
MKNKSIMKKLGVMCMLFCMAMFVQAQELKKGDAMPGFELNSSVYGKVSSADLKGKVVLVSLFATWCGPCQLELAEVQKTLWPKYKDNKDFKMLVIGREHTDEQLTKYNERKKFTFPLYPDPKREVFSLFAEKSIPRAYLFDKEGKLVYASVGYTEEEFQKLMSTIEASLK